MLYCSVQVILEPIKRIAFFSFFSWHRQFSEFPTLTLKTPPLGHAVTSIRKTPRLHHERWSRSNNFDLWWTFSFFSFFSSFLSFLSLLWITFCAHSSSVFGHTWKACNPWNHRNVGWKSRWKIIKGMSNADNLKIIWLIMLVYAIWKSYMSLAKYYICAYSVYIPIHTWKRQWVFPVDHASPRLSYQSTWYQGTVLMEFGKFCSTKVAINSSRGDVDSGHGGKRPFPPAISSAHPGPCQHWGPIRERPSGECSTPGQSLIFEIQGAKATWLQLSQTW